VLRSHESLWYVTAFVEAGVPTLGLEGGVGCNPRVTFDGKVRNLGPERVCCLLVLNSVTSAVDTLCVFSDNENPSGVFFTLFLRSFILLRELEYFVEPPWLEAMQKATNSARGGLPVLQYTHRER
jgi:hypothetical protein